jgi:signal peptidase II
LVADERPSEQVLDHAPTSATPDQRRALLVITVAVALITLAADQLSKAWAASSLDDGHTVGLILGARFTLSHNSGMAFSRGEGMGPVIGVLALVIVVVLLVSLKTGASRLAAVATGAVIGGAVGNVADRLFRHGGGFLRGEVVDFIEAAHWWPVFNVADIGIVVGGIVLALTALRHPGSKAAA